MLLNIKGISYTTQWVEYPSIADTLSSLSIPPANDTPQYTIPAIRLNGRHSMDSYAIAPLVESAHPTPSVHLTDPIVQRVRANVGRWSEPLRPVWTPQVPALLNPPSEEYFNRTRSAAMGRPLSEIKAEVDAGSPIVDQKWEEVRPAIEEAVAMLRENSAGPFFLGSEVSYADVIFVAAMHFFRRVNEDGLYKRLVAHGRELEELYAACEKWLARDN